MANYGTEANKVISIRHVHVYICKIISYVLNMCIKQSVLILVWGIDTIKGTEQLCCQISIIIHMTCSRISLYPQISVI